MIRADSQSHVSLQNVTSNRRCCWAEACTEGECKKSAGQMPECRDGRFHKCEPMTRSPTGPVNRSLHLIADRREVLQVDYRLACEAWIEPFRRFSGAGEKPD